MYRQIKAREWCYCRIVLSVAMVRFPSLLCFLIRLIASLIICQRGALSAFKHITAPSAILLRSKSKIFHPLSCYFGCCVLRRGYIETGITRMAFVGARTTCRLAKYCKYTTGYLAPDWQFPTELISAAGRKSGNWRNYPSSLLWKVEMAYIFDNDSANKWHRERARHSPDKALSNPFSCYMRLQ